MATISGNVSIVVSDAPADENMDKLDGDTTATLPPQPSPGTTRANTKKIWQSTKDHSADLRVGSTQLFDTIDSIIKVGMLGIDNPNLIYDSAKRQVEKEVNILQKYLDVLSAFEQRMPEEPENGERKEDNASIFDSLIKLNIQEISKMVSQMTCTIQDSMKARDQLIEEQKVLNEKIIKVEADKAQAVQMKNKALADKNVIRGTNQKLQEQLDEKSKNILNLNHDKNVISWQKEKQLWADGQGSREYELEKKVKEQEDEFVVSRHKMTTRIQELQDQIRKMKTEKSIASSSSKSPSVKHRSFRMDQDMNFISTEEELENMRKQLFHSERLLILEKSEVNRQRMYYAGLMKGVRKEWTMMMTRNDIFEKDYDLEQKNFFDRTQKIVDAIESGKVMQARKELPMYYQGVDIRLPDDVIQRCKSKYTARLENNAEAVLGLRDVKVNPATVSWRDGDEAAAPNLYDEMKELRSHPKLEDADGKLKVEIATEHFRNFNQERIIALHEMFNGIDTNQNHVLDTDELMVALAKPNSINRTCSREEVHEALMEIDSDDSGSVDFFEFLLLLTRLERGELKSKLFDTKAFRGVANDVKDMKDNKKSSEKDSKTCLIQ